MLLPRGEPFRELVGGSASRVENPSNHRQIVNISPVNRHPLPDLHTCSRFAGNIDPERSQSRESVDMRSGNRAAPDQH
ncbi:MAG: hypothetical protein DRR11_06465 [Gammaproteobacteria bacterium]|nr:MAG: hypothetical protein DRR11_06465 [Gammaproteobacteria bacterium]RLA37353.1 MAG: hypothetical protein DRR15_02235 [Gammaproteobacteria bacterium]